MIFCPFNQEQQCTSKCAIWSDEGLCCSLLRLPKTISRLTEEIVKIEEAIRDTD